MIQHIAAVPAGVSSFFVTITTNQWNPEKRKENNKQNNHNHTLSLTIVLLVHGGTDGVALIAEDVFDVASSSRQSTNVCRVVHHHDGGLWWWGSGLDHGSVVGGLLLHHHWRLLLLHLHLLTRHLHWVWSVCLRSVTWWWLHWRLTHWSTHYRLAVLWLLSVWILWLHFLNLKTNNYNKLQNYNLIKTYLL